MIDIFKFIIDVWIDFIVLIFNVPITEQINFGMLVIFIIMLIFGLKLLILKDHSSYNPNYNSSKKGGK